MPVARVAADGLRLLLAGCFLCIALVCSAREYAVAVQPATGSIQVAFPAWDDAEGLLIETLNLARSQVLMQAFLLANKKSHCQPAGGAPTRCRCAGAGGCPPTCRQRGLLARLTCRCRYSCVA